MLTAKEAFKVGFCLKLAESGVLPEDLLPLVQEKQATVGSAARGLGATALLASTVGPAMAGRSAGATLKQLEADELETLSEARKRYMLKRYQDLIARREAELESRLASQAIREVRE